MPAAEPRRTRLLRLAPLFAAAVLAFLTTSARQWEGLAGNLPGWFRRGNVVPQAYGAFRFAPSGNEWRLRRWTTFGADLIELRRSFTIDDTVDPIADARAAFPESGIHHSLLLARPTGRSGLTWTAFRLGWPMRHTQVDQLGRRSRLPIGFTVDTLFYTPVWLAIIHLIRLPIAAIGRHFRIPEYACRACRYDLRGLPDDAPCPECGRSRPA